ncbi:MAG TPA: MarR family transcriptional regulator [Steroidobacteraceae bacterium]|jgi:DNA-binding MarR family transcriptional regulator|nr:MarR family transcriptional regulator [Steroidobacteraceae bacterium]
MNRLRSFGFLLRDVSRLYVRRFEQRADVLGLTLPQCRALVYLALHEGISQARLAELTDVEPMTLVRILDRMAANGWLERRVDATDRRVRLVYLTAKARPVVEDIWKLADLTREEAFRHIPRKQVGALIILLDQIRGNLATLKPLPVATAGTRRRRAVLQS